MIQALDNKELTRENRELKLELERRSLIPKENFKPAGANADEVAKFFLNFIVAIFLQAS